MITGSLSEAEKASFRLLLQSPFFVPNGSELMIYYEMNSELMFYKADAFKKFLQRSGSRKLSRHHWEMAHGFVKILFQLIQSPRANRRHSKRILKRIGQMNVAERQWLIEKAQALGRRAGA